MASWLVAHGPGLSPGPGDCVVFLGKTLSVPLSTQEYKWVPANCWGNYVGNDLRWTSIPSMQGE